MIGKRWKRAGESKSFAPGEVSLPLRRGRGWPPRDDSHQNHNCLRRCRSLIRPRKFSISRLIYFSAVYLFNKGGGRKPGLFSLNFWLLFRLKLLPREGGETRKVRPELPSRGRYYHAVLCRVGCRGPHPDARHNMGHSVSHLANIIR